MNLLERNEVIRAYLRGLPNWEREHADRVAVYSVATAVQLKMPARQLLTIRYAATLHGAVGQDQADIFRLPFLRAAGKIVAALPGMADDEIPLAARIIGACEAFDRLAHGSPGVEPSADPWAELESAGFDLNVVKALRHISTVIQPIGT